MLPSFANDAPVRVRPTWTTDARGTRRPDYGAGASRVTVPGSLVQPGASVEVLENRVGAVAVRWSWFAPAGTDVVATDAVEWDGRLFAVDGEPARHRSPTGALDHVLVLLIDWKG
jgi:hypothetical protein